MRNARKDLLAGLLAVGCSILALPALAATAADGLRVYEKVCRHCHEAGVGPVLKGRKLPPEYIQRMVRSGNRAMPAFRPSEIDEAALLELGKLIMNSTAGAPLGQ
jgi:mono/diheme cytochrome c family protein